MFLGSIERDHSKKCVGVRERPADLNGLSRGESRGRGSIPTLSKVGYRILLLYCCGNGTANTRYKGQISQE